MAKQRLQIKQGKIKDEVWDDTFQMMSWWKPEEVQNAKVMVVGAGALGNEVLKNLALMNVGNILIIDFDIIEYKNLCRSVLFREADVEREATKAEVAAKRIREINPNIKVHVITGDIMIDVGLGIMRRMDVIIGCLDNRIARLHINRYANKVGKIWVDGAIENMSGHLCVYKPKVSCYECGLTDVDWDHIRVRLGCADIAQRNTDRGRVPTTPISSSIIAAMQVQEALKVIHGYHDKSMAGDAFRYDGMNNWIFTYKVDELQDGCQSHYTIPEQELILAKELSHNSTIGDALTWLTEYFNDSEISIKLNYKVVTEISTRITEITHSLVIAEPHFSESLQLRYEEQPGEGIAITKFVDRLDKNFEKMGMKLLEVGIPALQILTVETSDDIYFVELTGDEGILVFE